jgi:hypothetical protein
MQCPMNLPQGREEPAKPSSHEAPKERLLGGSSKQSGEPQTLACRARPPASDVCMQAGQAPQTLARKARPQASDVCMQAGQGASDARVQGETASLRRVHAGRARRLRRSRAESAAAAQR